MFRRPVAERHRSGERLDLGLIAGYGDGKTSATITRRPDGSATISMVSPDPVRKAQWEQAHSNANPFD